MKELDAAPLGSLATEARNPASERIDELSTSDMLAVIIAADFEATRAVEAKIPHIAAAIDAISARIATGGRLFYIGAGTSGRLGVLDAERGARDLKGAGFTAKDAVVGIAASGRTPYVLGAMKYARSLGALTIGLSCVPNSAVGSAAEIAISPVTGAEVLTGSTRLKAGTATKLVLNMLSTGVMIRSGYVYGHFMVNVQMTNAKLVDRAARIVSAITGLDREVAGRLLDEAGSVKTAVVMAKLGISREAAEARLTSTSGKLRQALGEH